MAQKIQMLFAVRNVVLPVSGPSLSTSKNGMLKMLTTPVAGRKIMVRKASNFIARESSFIAALSALASALFVLKES